jgi:hypothetical protein
MEFAISGPLVGDEVALMTPGSLPWRFGASWLQEFFVRRNGCDWH